VAADRLLAELENDIDEALQDIRRLVYNLRPPALDELGLVAAIRAAATQYAQEGARSVVDGGMHIWVEALEPLPPLPAAVEVAAYRIVQEALTNVVRHAHARSCLIRLAIDPTLLSLEIRDDGVGLPRERHAGVGLQSMHERAEELGGMCQIEAEPVGGTRVLAQLPLLPDGNDTR
jgi:signal transduction histidine kinase